MATSAGLSIVLSAQDLASAPIRGVSGALGGLGSVAGKIGGALGGLAQIAGGFALGQGLVALPGMLMDAVGAAQEDEAATLRLQQALRNIGGDFDSHLAKVNEAITAGQKLAFSDDEVRDSFQFLAAATGDVDEALRRQKSAMDLAKGANIPLAQATKMLGKMSGENVEVFKKLGITLGDTATEADALAAVQAKFGGQAEVYAQSTAGQFAQAKLALSETSEAIGNALLPIMTTLARTLADALPTIQAWVGSLAEIGGGIVRSALSALEPLAAVVKTLGEYFGFLVESGDYLNDSLADLPSGLQPLVGLIGSVVAAFQSLFSGDFAGAIDNLVDGFSRMGPRIVEQLGGLITSVASWIGEQVPVLIKQLLTWGGAFVAWVTEAAPKVLEALGTFAGSVWTWISETAGTLATKALEWATAFATWASEMLPLVNAKLVAFVGGLWDWITGMVPGLVERLQGWVAAFSDWVDAAAPLALEKAGAFLQQVNDWITGVALPTLYTQAGQWAEAFFAWIGEALPHALDKLSEFLTGLIDGIGAGEGEIGASVEAKWVPAFLSFAEKVVVGIANSLPKIQAAFQRLIESLALALLRLTGRLVGALSDWIRDDLIPAAEHQFNLFKARLEVWFLTIAVPAMQQFGRDLVNGLIVGLLDLKSTLEETAIGVGESLLTTLGQALGIGSPSWITERFGEEVGVGLEIGLKRGIPGVNAAGQALGQAALAPVQAAMQEIARLTGSPSLGAGLAHRAPGAGTPGGNAGLGQGGGGFGPGGTMYTGGDAWYWDPNIGGWRGKNPSQGGRYTRRPGDPPPPKWLADEWYASMGSTAGGATNIYGPVNITAQNDAATELNRLSELVR